ncbi:probable serine/threonine-protein kinase PBL11 isoform X1 [Rosa rugosa]|uniref:probable serine/threonine-protein kinase PBL11 isoform X1 n=1 Tax=Rosa rugosa TaxID=74645 RepID=UPI002B402AF4|nr:probable serine/threonine-protein kinase PBL11 isoform X1 [Rosa rugosa]XP_062001213.1 probable serine/threonine-protein kinase PBL11 isoform X1 [Rosa rugosa]XP_062001214.1 probable serine/threonine-protein kinase PBL11 isoform X1 [Rosa rugosa]XP_062001215.1 probable serine/threonine-protein kinase PBL11 isoform X1 [Rosa rugosa]XP_062001216.1 probable serine/threonine-protein kinase PBL11 isoform X1 [Rosa rugosa]
MSGGIRTSVKGYLIAKRLAFTGEIDTVQEVNDTINSNLTGPQASDDSIDKRAQDHPGTSRASTSYGLSIGDDGILHLSMLSNAAKSMDSNWNRICRAVSLPHDAKGSSAAVSSCPRTEGEILLRRFFLNELKMATWNFHPDNMVGEGGFGSVFKGWVDDSSTAANPGKGMLIAVKRINKEGFLGHEQWLAEIYYLGRLRHPNLVTLLGYCFEDDHRLLVFEFMSRGGLDNHLFGRDSCLQPLSWILRMKISLEAANVLAFLHNGEETVIHRDITSSNILLDSTYNAKLADFGLAKDGPAGDKSHVTTAVMGTHGYAAPEYIATGHLTAKCDVYGFGVVMLEMLSGRRSLDQSLPTGQHNLVEWAKPYLASKRGVHKVFDPRLKGQYSVAGALKAANLAKQCLSEEPEFRPNMTEVVKALEQLQEPEDMKGLKIPQNEPCQSPRANSSNRRRSTSWISFMPSASRSYT